MSDVENTDYTAFARRIIAAAGKRCGKGDVDMLPALRALHQDVENAERAAVYALLSEGFSAADCARRLGITRQTFSEKYRQGGPDTESGQTTYTGTREGGR